MLKTGAKIERVEPDYLVNLSDIAERSGLTRQAISLYTKAERGSGFPNPVARVTSNSPLWDWLEVTEWLHAQAKIDREAVVEARIVKEANRFLELHDEQSDNFTRRLELHEDAGP
jgi:predicted DNA-binding transcriptional regulator AlpA